MILRMIFNTMAERRSRRRSREFKSARWRDHTISQPEASGSRLCFCSPRRPCNTPYSSPSSQSNQILKLDIFFDWNADWHLRIVSSRTLHRTKAGCFFLSGSLQGRAELETRRCIRSKRSYQCREIRGFMLAVYHTRNILWDPLARSIPPHSWQFPSLATGDVYSSMTRRSCSLPQSSGGDLHD